MNRKEMKPSKDSQIFRNTAVKTKRVNIQPKISRGGTRL